MKKFKSSIYIKALGRKVIGDECTKADEAILKDKGVNLNDYIEGETKPKAKPKAKTE